MFNEMTLFTASYLGFCAGAMITTLCFGGALALSHWRKGRSEEVLKQANAHLDSHLDTCSGTQADAHPTAPSNPFAGQRIKWDPVVRMAQSASIVHVLEEYAQAFRVLDDWDHERLVITKTTPSKGQRIDYDHAISQIKLWQEREDLGPLFGNEKDDSFQSSLNAIYASFDGHDLYPSAEEKAAHLLYFIVKNHSFTDGNKRIGAAMFAWFLHRNNCLDGVNGQKRLANNALVAITLLIAQSDPAHKERLITLVVNLINQSH